MAVAAMSIAMAARHVAGAFFGFALHDGFIAQWGKHPSVCT